MFKSTIFEKTGKNKEDILKKVLKEYDVREELVELEMLEEAKEGFLGFIGNQPAKAKITIYPDRQQIASDFVTELIENINDEAEISIECIENNFNVYVEGQDVGNIIGKRGATLNAVQYLTNIIANRFEGTPKLKVDIDVSGYRKSRTKSLEELSEKLADKVLKSQQGIEIEPMNSQERKIIHITLKERNDVFTYSAGEEPNRKVIITCKEDEIGTVNDETSKRKPYRRKRTNK